MKIKGMLYDVARDLAGNEQYYMNMIDRLAAYDYNMLILNLEYRFCFPSHPSIAMPDGLTPDVVRRLDKYAKERGIELVPFMNCSGHCDGIGMTDKYCHLCTDDMQSNSVEQLYISNPEAKQLILDLYNDLYDCFSSKYFHVGGDEVRQLDKIFPDLDPDERMRIGIEFLNEMIADVKAHGKIPMVWGDMLYKHPGVLEIMDPDAIICDWSYFSAPDFKELSNKKTLSFFRKSKRPTVFADAATSFTGNPVTADTSTRNIVFGSEEYLEMFGEDAVGIIVTTWDIKLAGAFDVVWPWIYLQSRINAGEKRDFRSFSFLGEYATLEWGLPEGDDKLEQWYRLMDTEFNKMVSYEAFLDKKLRPALEDMGNRPFKLMRVFYNRLFSSRNILPLISAERVKWLTPYMLDKSEEIYRKALALAEQMDSMATKRKEEARHLLQYNKVMLTILKLVRLEAELEECYHQAANIQFADPAGYKAKMNELSKICLAIAGEVDVMAAWGDILYKEDNRSADACVLTPLCAADLRVRAENIIKIAESGVSLVSYQRFIRRDPDMPMVRHLGREFAK